MSVPTSYKIDTTRSLRIGRNSDREPATIQGSFREDSPVPSEPVEASIYRNVLPTDRGYRSSFGLSPVNLPDTGYGFKYIQASNRQEAPRASPKQDVLWLETGSLHCMGVMLGEDGIWIILPSLRSELTNEEAVEVGLPVDQYNDQWRLIIPMVFTAGTRYLWTHAIIDGVLYAYRQGDPVIYILTDMGYTMRSESGQLVWENDYLQAAIYSAVPTFINMEGQIGLFRADNRLGFWDSDNAIAWSSPLDKLDFKPDATTFAGVAKYSEVAGTITKVAEHGKGFIVYASRSIVHCQSMPNSPEKWSGTALINNSGVQYDTQIAVGHPTTIHYVWVDGSLAIIDNGNLAFSLPELADMVRTQGTLVRLAAPCSRYLYVSMAQQWVGGNYERRARILVDSNGDPFYRVPGYKEEDITIPVPGFWQFLLEGAFEDPTESAEDLEPIEPVPDLKERKPLIPFYSGHKYVTPPNSVRLMRWVDPSPMPVAPLLGGVASHVWPEIVVEKIDPIYMWEGVPQNSGIIEAPTEVDDVIWTGHLWPTMTRTQWDMSQIDQIGTRFIDKAGQEFLDLVHESLDAYIADAKSILDLLNDDLLRRDHQSKFFDERSISPVTGGYNKGWTYDMPYACYDEQPPEPYATTGANQWLIDAILEDDLTRYDGILIHDLGIVAGVVPVDYGIDVEYNGCVMRIAGRMGSMRCFAIQYLGDETVFKDSRHCLTPPDYPIDPDNPTWSPMVTTETNPTHNGNVTLAFHYVYVIDEIIGKDAEERKFLLTDRNSPLWTTIFQADVSGWGYEDRVSSTWTRYVKTHIKHSSSEECVPTGPYIGEAPPPDFEEIEVDYEEEEAQPPFPFEWWPGYEDRIPGQIVPSLEFFYPEVGDVRANFLKGTKHPYYPTYAYALVWDNLLKKWGSLNQPHQMVYSQYPVNSNTQVQTGETWDSESGRLTAVGEMLSAGIIPVFMTPNADNWDDEYAWVDLEERFYQGYSRNVLAQHLLPTGLSVIGRNGLIVYTKIGAQRAGHTLFTGISVKLWDTASGNRDSSSNTVVEFGASLSNHGYDLENVWPNYAEAGITQRNVYSKQTGSGEFEDLEAPARIKGRWASVAVYGQFDLTGIVVYGKPAGRLRYFVKQMQY